jgi:excisionase family DNA binding protein
VSGIKPADQLLTVKEVADLLRLAPSTVFDAAARGDLPCVRLWKGRRKSLLRFRREQIERLMNEGMTPRNQETGPGKPTPSQEPRVTTPKPSSYRRTR